MHSNKRFTHGLMSVALLATFIVLIGSTPAVTAQEVTITSNTAASRNLYIQWSADEPERIEVIKWNPAGLDGSEPNLTNAVTFGGTSPCHNRIVEYFGN